MRLKLNWPKLQHQKPTSYHVREWHVIIVAECIVHNSKIGLIVHCKCSNSANCHDLQARREPNAAGGGRGRNSRGGQHRRAPRAHPPGAQPDLRLELGRRAGHAPAAPRGQAPGRGAARHLQTSTMPVFGRSFPHTCGTILRNFGKVSQTCSNNFLAISLSSVGNSETIR